MELNKRRRQLRMSYAALAKRSGVSLPTVVRTLVGHNPQVSFANVFAIAKALAMEVKVEPNEAAHIVREQQAQEKARKLVGMVQGTSALEAQAVDEGTLDEMTRQTMHELLAGSGRKLWSD